MKKKKAPKNLNEVRFMMSELISEINNKEIEPAQAKSIIGAASVITKISAIEYMQAQATGVVKQIDFMSQDFSKPKTLIGLSLAEVATI